MCVRGLGKILRYEYICKIFEILKVEKRVEIEKKINLGGRCKCLSKILIMGKK